MLNTINLEFFKNLKFLLSLLHILQFIDLFKNCLNKTFYIIHHLIYPRLIFIKNK